MEFKETNDISLESKVGKKCSLWPISFDGNGLGWISGEYNSFIFRGVVENIYVVECIVNEKTRSLEDLKEHNRLYYLPISGVQLCFKKEDL